AHNPSIRLNNMLCQSAFAFNYRIQQQFKVVDQIDTLTSDLQLEDEMTDSSKTDTLNSSSSGTTASSIEKIKVQANAPLIKPPAHPSAILTVLRKPNPPPPPPRLTPVKCEEPPRVVPTVNPVKTNGTLLRNGGLPAVPPPTAPKPQKTILRKSTTTTV
ncbi:hypothetical protein U0070_024639, partial [Myodes glareolus]